MPSYHSFRRHLHFSRTSNTGIQIIVSSASSHLCGVVKMCIQFYREYMCGCIKDEEFCQCRTHYGSNVACAEVERTEIYKANNLCRDHLITAGDGQKLIRVATWNTEKANGELPHSQAVTAFKATFDDDILAGTWDAAEFVRRNLKTPGWDKAEKKEEERTSLLRTRQGLKMTRQEDEDFRKEINKEAADNALKAGAKKAKKKKRAEKREHFRVIFKSAPVS